MAIPFTKLYLSAAVSNVLTGYRFLPQAAGDFAPTITTTPAPTWIAGIADLNGDLIPDVIIGAPGDDDKFTDAGRIFIEFGHTSGTLASATSTTGIIIDGVNAGDLSGAAIGSITDLNADGKSEILIGAPGMDNGASTDAGAGFVIWGLASGSVDLGDPATGGGKGYVIKGEAAGDQAGQTMTSIADLNGDGKAEVLIGASGNDASGADSGAAYVVWGKSSSAIVNLTNVTAGSGGYRIMGQRAGDAAGKALATLADQNGDGKAEILVGAAGNEAGGVNAGAAYVVFGKSTTAPVDLNAVAAGAGGYRITGSAGENAGSAITGLGDINGDGLSDILVGASGSGKAYVVFGKNNTSEVLLSDVAAGNGGFVINPEYASDLARLSVATGGDFNRDGIADIVIGTPTNIEGGLDAGAVYVVWGGNTHKIDLALVSQGIGGAKIVGSAGSLTGSSVSVLQDMNGDSTPDLLIASPGSAGESVSVVYAPNTWQADNNIYGTNDNDAMDVGYGGTRKIGTGDDAIMGLNGNDSIHGGDGNDSIEGNAGNDVLYGDAGNDTLDGGTGIDILNGGLGDDTYRVDNVSDNVQEIDGEGLDTVIASIGGYTLAANVENLQLSGASLSGTGNDLNNSITGTAGNDTLNGGLGADTLIGGLGNDTYLVDNPADLTQEAPNAGTDNVSSGIDWTLDANIENLILTGSARIGIGNTLNNSITGTAGNDTLDGGAGNDTLIGGLGDDTYYVDSVGDVAQEAASTDIDTVIASINYTLAANIEALQLAGTALTATGNALNNTLTGTSGNNTLDGGIGADTLIGGLGDDTYYVDNVGDAIQEDINSGTDTVITGIDNYILTTGASIENLTLAGSALTATGNELDNILTGTSGNNTLDGGVGVDTLIGGLGDDSYRVDDINDVVQEAMGAGTDTVIASVDYILATDVENLQLSGIGHIGTGNVLDNKLTGTSDADTLYGLGGNDILDGGLGNDTLVGGDGDDTYYIDNINDVIIETVGGGIDRVYTNIDNWLPNDNIENISLTGTAHMATGNALNNSLTGTAGNDTIDGGAGDDLEVGGDGDDVLISGAGIDTLAGGSGDDRYVLKGGQAKIEDFLGHDTIDASQATGDSSIDLTTGLFHVEGQDCRVGTAGTTSSPLDVQFLQDLTGSFADDITTVRGLVPQIVSALQAVQTNSEFGVSTFRDKPIGAFGGVGDWVYQMPLSLTTASGTLTSAYASMIANNGADGPEAQIEALMQLALHSSDVGFRPDSAHFVVLFTDAPFHNAGDGASAGITTPNNGDAIMDAGPSGIAGTGEDYPLIQQVQSALAAANIIPIFAVAGGYESTYQGLVTSLGRGTVVTLTADSSNVVGAITGGLTAATTTRIEDAEGGAGNDTLTGNILANTLTGNGGNDILAGNDGDDRLEGNTGNDILTGGAGSDTFVFSKGDNQDEITDDSAGNVGVDTVKFFDVASTDVVSVSQILNTNNLLLIYGAGDQITVDGYFGANPTGSIAQFQFSDGATWARADVLPRLTGSNDAPALTGSLAILANGSEDASQIISTADLLQGYTDANGDTLAIANLSASHGTIANNGDTTWTFTPTANYNGTVNLTYQVVDGRGGIVAANQSLSLAAVNDAPQLSGATATLPAGSEDVSYTINATDLLAGYSDVDGDTLSVANLAANNGTLTDNLNGSWTFVPTSNYNGAVSLIYDVIDGQGGSIDANRPFNLAAVNDAPELTGTLATLANGTENTNYILSTANLLVGYSDVDGDVLTVADLVADHGTVTDNGDGTWTLVPSANYYGRVNLSYNVIDGNGGTTPAGQAFDLQFLASNAAPMIVAATVNASSVSTTAVYYSGSLAFTDDNTGDTHSCSPALATGTAGGNLTTALSETTGAGSVAWNYSYTLPTTFAATVQSKTDSFDVMIDDGQGGTVSRNLSINITTGTSGINALNGSTGIDILLAAGGNDIVIGLDGNDTLDGGSGADSLSGGLGDDTYLVDNAGDATTEGVDEGIDHVISKISHTLAANVENLTLNGTTALKATGNSSANIIIGGSGNNVLDGLAGADTLIGGLGNDTYLIDNTGDVVIEAVAEGTDLIKSSISFDLNATSNVENLTLLGSDSVNATGDAGANTLTGNVGNNILVGGAGIDKLVGGGGNDTYVVNITATGTLEDTVTANTGIDTVLVQGIYSATLKTLTVAAMIENYDISATGASLFNLTGNANNNILTGNDANNLINGGAGIDTLAGGLGDDTYTVDNIADNILENADAGTDLVNSSVSFDLSSNGINVEKLTLTGTALINATGNDGNNLITGNAVNNTLLGNGGNDTLYGLAGIDIIDGGNGNDLLAGGAGSDTLTGGTGSDIFWSNTALNATSNVDSISDFVSGTDSLQLSVSVMAKLGLTGQFAAADARFWSNTTGLAHDADDRIIYNSANGELIYDSNGSAAGGTVLIEVLAAAPTVAATDIWVV